MRVIVVVSAVLVMAALVSSLPNTSGTPRSRGRPEGSRLVEGRPGGRNRPEGSRPPVTSRPPTASSPASASSTGSKLTPQTARRPTPSAAGSSGVQPSRRPTSTQTSRRGPRPSTTTTTTTYPTTDPTTTEEGVTEGVTESGEVREVGVNGWLAAPTPEPLLPQSRTEAPSKPDKDGSCGTPKGFGIKCMSRLDQCLKDSQCPGATKCCMVGECGYLCVKPKPTSSDTKPTSKLPGNKVKTTSKTEAIQGREETSETPIETPIQSREAGETEETPEIPENSRARGQETSESEEKMDEEIEGGLANAETTLENPALI